MVFYLYEEAMKGVAKISVDGIVPQSFHLSHWKGNKTPAPLKADTATEIVMRYISHPDRKSFFPQINIVTNNHFDTDGLLSVWALLHPHKAEPISGRLVAAAEAGDHSIFSSEEGVQVNLLINALCHSEESPMASHLATSTGSKQAAYYKALFPLLPDIFRKKDNYRSLWRRPFDEILLSMELFEKGIIGLEEHPAVGLSVVIDEQRPAREAIDHFCQGNLFLVIEDREREEGGFAYELEYRYYAWAETVTRPLIPTVPMESLAERLNKQEGSTEGKWLTQGYAGRSMTSALRFTDAEGKRHLSRLHPDQVLQQVLSHLPVLEESDDD